jgi:hypothetical protein
VDTLPTKCCLVVLFASVKKSVRCELYLAKMKPRQHSTVQPSWEDVGEGL